MRFVYDVVVLLHLLGMAAVVGGYLATLARPRVLPLMVWGARAQLVTGLVLVVMAETVDSLHRDPDIAKMVVKLVLSLVVVACAEIWTARSTRSATAASPSAPAATGAPGGAAAPVVLVHVCGWAAVAATAVAALWR